MIAAVPRPPVDWFAISPSLILLGVAGACLLFAVLVPESARRMTSAATAAGGFVGAFVAAILLFLSAWPAAITERVTTGPPTSTTAAAGESK